MEFLANIKNGQFKLKKTTHRNQQSKSAFLSRIAKRDPAIEAKRKRSNTQMHIEFKKLLQMFPDGGNVAVLSMSASLCPVTLGHIQAFIEARKLLLASFATNSRPSGLEPFVEVFGLLTANPDRFVVPKMELKGEPHIPLKDRCALASIAVAEIPWLHSTLECGFVISLRRQFPKYRFFNFSLNGADDVLKYEKWKMCTAASRFITMGRPGSTKKVLEGATAAGIDLSVGHFVMGPELPDISSTAVRVALRKGATKELQRLLHPAVMKWCLQHGPYQADSQDVATNKAPSQNRTAS